MKKVPSASLGKSKFEEIQKMRQAELKPLFDDLERYGLRYSNIHELIDEPENTFALSIERMVEYLDILQDEVNLGMLSMALSRKEGVGVVAKPMLKRLKIAATEDGKFQAARAIRATAEMDDVSDLEKIIHDSGTSFPVRRELIRAVLKMDKSRKVDFLVSCFNLGDETTIFCLRHLKKIRYADLRGCQSLIDLLSHENVKIRELAKDLYSQS